MEDEINVGNLVECIETTDKTPGCGFQLGLQFIVKSIKIYPDGDVVYFGGHNGNGVFKPYVKKIGRGKFKLQRK